MNQFTVSFIIPVYNVSKYLQQCVDSILMQSISNYEIILVNDGSTDNSLEICKKFEENYPFIHVVDQRNSGVSVARNNGMKTAQGKYLCFLDGDDYYISDFAQDFYDTCERQQLDIIRGTYKIWDEETRKHTSQSKTWNKNYDQVLSGRDFLIHSFQEQANEVVPWLGFFRRDFVMTHSITFPVGIAFEEDHPFFLNALLVSSCRAMHKNEYFYSYRQRAGSATGTLSAKKALDALEIVSSELAIAEKIEDKTIRRYVKKYIGSSFFQVTCVYGRIPREDRKAVRKQCTLKARIICSLYAANNYQRLKNFLFSFLPFVVDFVYSIKKMNGK